MDRSQLYNSTHPFKIIVFTDPLDVWELKHHLDKKKTGPLTEEELPLLEEQYNPTVKISFQSEGEMSAFLIAIKILTPYALWIKVN